MNTNNPRTPIKHHPPTNSPGKHGENTERTRGKGKAKGIDLPALTPPVSMEDREKLYGTLCKALILLARGLATNRKKLDPQARGRLLRDVVAVWKELHLPPPPDKTKSMHDLTLEELKGAVDNPQIRDN